MDRNSRRTVTCIDDALRMPDISNTDRLILLALREFIVEQWAPHLDIAHEYIEKMNRMDVLVGVASKRLLEPPRPGEAALIDVLEKTAQRVEVWLDAGCWFVRYGWWMIGGIITGLVWLIRNQHLLT